MSLRVGNDANPTLEFKFNFVLPNMRKRNYEAKK